MAQTFNRLHPNMSVGKSFVAQLLQAQQYEIAQMRREMRFAKPRSVVVNDGN